MTEKTAETHRAAAGATAEFERIYRANVDAVTAYFARRTADAQLVADLTADTFVAVIAGFGSFDPRQGTARAWVFGIARHVYAAHCAAYSQQQDRLRRLAGRRDLDPDQVEELLERIDAERDARGLIAALAALPAADREVIELVDIAGLRPREAAAALGLAPGTVRMRLLRARGRLRHTDTQDRGNRFADQLFDDLMREHGAALADPRGPGAPRRRVARPVLLAAGAAVAAVGTAAGLLAAGGGTPAYAVTRNADGTVSVAVRDQSGIAGANAALRKMGEQIALVQVKADCESVTSLPLVSRDGGYVLSRLRITKSSDGSVVVEGGLGGPWTISGKSVPKGEVALVLVQETSKGMELWNHVIQWEPVSPEGSSYAIYADTITLTRAPAPSCVSVPLYRG